MVKNVLKKNEKRRKNNKGFSLVELIVVIAIMAVLVGVLAPQLIKYVEKSRESTDIQTCDNIVTAMKTYYADKENASTVTVTLDSSSTDLTESAAVDAGLAKSHLKGKNWNSIVITYNPTTGEVSYTINSPEGKTPYYEVKDGKIEAK
ncbi:type II secretion system protein [Agathobacter sp.]